MHYAFGNIIRIKNRNTQHCKNFRYSCFAAANSAVNPILSIRVFYKNKMSCLKTLNKGFKGG
jgi:hypothetical protein